MRIVLSVFLFFAIVLMNGCATTRDHVCEDCTISADKLKKTHIPRLASGGCTWTMARLLGGDIFFLVEQGVKWKQLGITEEWLVERIEVARLNDITRAKHELEEFRAGKIDPNRIFQIRAPVVMGICTWEEVGATPKEQELIEDIISPPVNTASGY